MMTDVTLRRFENPAAFRRAAEPFLLRDEATHCLQLGLISGIEAGEWRDPFLAVLEANREAVLVAMRAPPYDLTLSSTERAEAIRVLVNHVRAVAADAAIPGALGPARASDAFAEAWAASTGATPRLTRRQRIYRLERVTPITGVPGSARRTMSSDRALLEAWIEAFHMEALPTDPVNVHEVADRWLSSPQREAWFWEDAGEPVALAGAGGRTANGVRIGMVYTPPGRRQRGYASALVADLSSRQLAAGRRFCFLYTDLDNPTSNRLYPRLGYEPVRDVHGYRFPDPPESPFAWKGDAWTHGSARSS